MMTFKGDPFESRDLKLTWEPEPLRSADGDYIHGRDVLFEDWVENFVAKTGAWPGGPYFMTPQELDVELRKPGWSIPIQQYATRLSREEEFAESARFVPAARLVRALRRSPKRMAYYLGVSSLPRPFEASYSKIVWKFEDVAELLLLAERIENVFTNNELISEEGALQYSIFIPAPRDVSERDIKKLFIKANLDKASDFQLAKIHNILFDGPDRATEELPAAAPRLWRDRSAAERINGKGFVSPAAFMLGVYGPWLSKGLLGEDDLDLLDPELLVAYRRWIYRHKRDRIAALKPGLSELEKRVYSIRRSTPWTEIERIALAVAKDRQRRMARQAKPKVS